MRVPLSGLISAIGLTALSAGAAAAAPSVQIKDAVARVVVIPEARSDIKIETITRNAALPLTLRVQGDQTVVDGGLKFGKITGCSTKNGATKVRVFGVGEVKWEDIPQIVIRTPMAVDLGAGGAVFGSIGRSESLAFANSGCGDWTLANVRDDLHMSLAGSGDVRGGSAARASISQAGSGDVALQGLGDGADISIAGSGDSHITRLQGRLTVQIAGSGDVTVGSGHASTIKVSIAGSGDVDFGGEADDLSAQIMGSGDVHVRQVLGPVSKSIMGSGDVTVGGK